MAFPQDQRLTEAKAKSIVEVAQALQLSNLKPNGHELTGPCPRCGGTDRFNVSLRKQKFLCRHCEENGGKGDGVALVMFVLDCDFVAALDWLCGPPRVLSDAEKLDRAETEKRALAAQRRTLEASARMRAQSIAAGHRIWTEGLPAENTLVREYLTRRGIGRDLLPQLPRCLRFHPSLPYVVSVKGAGRQVIYRGPAMLAAVQGLDGRFTAVHRTWLDLAQPKGKLHLVHDGQVAEVKKSLGSTKGGAIRLMSPPNAEMLIMGEGIETTFSAQIANAYPGAAYWAGVDLGNMAGRKLSGHGRKYSGLPDLRDDRAFVPPDWVRHLIFVKDGDSEPRFTESQILAGLRRAMALRPGLRAQVVRAPVGLDLNDILLSGGPDAA